MVNPEPNLSVKIGRIRMENPVMAASGTFGYAKEYEDIVEIKRLGAVVTKTITNEPRSGNPPPRVVETASGMLNSIGLENDGVEVFLEKRLPYLKKIGIPVIVSISGGSVKDFAKLTERLDGVSGIAGLEINISCPNLHNEGQKAKGRKLKLFSQDRMLTYKVVRSVRRATNLTIITKLTPNVTDITEIAKAAEDGGSDALSLVNTYAAMAVDAEKKIPMLGNITGGLSGPAIKPMALKAVWDVYNTTNLPIIGSGGIMALGDVLEFLICGAAAVALGSVNFVYPCRTTEIIEGLQNYARSKKMKLLRRLTGTLKV